MEEPTTNTTTGNTDTDMMARIVSALELIARAQVKQVQELIELRRELRAMHSTYCEVHHHV